MRSGGAGYMLRKTTRILDNKGTRNGNVLYCIWFMYLHFGLACLWHITSNKEFWSKPLGAVVSGAGTYRTTLSSTQSSRLQGTSLLQTRSTSPLLSTYEHANSVSRASLPRGLFEVVCVGPYNVMADPSKFSGHPWRAKKSSD